MAKGYYFVKDKHLDKLLLLTHFYLPTEKDIFEDFKGFEKAKPTDLALLAGINGNKYFLRDEHGKESYDVSYVSDGTKTTKSLNDDDDKYNTNRYSRFIGIRPIIYFEGSEELFDAIITKEDGTKAKTGDIVKFGKFPATALSMEGQHFYDQLRKEKKLVKLKDKYVFDKTHVRKTHQKFSPLVYNPYEYSVPSEEGSKEEKVQCILWKYNPNYKRVCFYDDSYREYEETTLSNSHVYKKNDEVWLQVEDVEFIVNVEKKTMLAKNILVAGVQFENYSRHYYTLDYSSSNIEDYLGYVRQAILNSVDYKALGYNTGDIEEEKEEIKEELPEDEFDNEVTKEIYELRNSIKEHLRFYLGDRDFLSETDQKIQEYNEKILHPPLELELVPGTNNPDNLYSRLKLELEDFIAELRENSEKVRGYFDMMDILNECKKDDINISLHEICRIIKAVKSITNDVILNEEVKEEMTKEYNDLIDKHLSLCKEELENYKNGHTNETKTLEKLAQDFQKDLRPILVKLNKVVSEQNVVERIIDGVNQIIKNIKDENDNLRRTYFVRQIDDVVNDIRKKNNEDEKQELDTLLDGYHPSKDSRIKVVIEDYVNMLRRLLSLQMKIDDRIFKDKARMAKIINLPTDDEKISVNKR